MVSAQSHYHLTYTLETSGFLNILQRLNRKVDTLFIDVEKHKRVTRNNNTWAFVSKDDLRTKISSFFTPDYKVVTVLPDTVFAIVGKAFEKMVPVRVVTNLTFAKGFGTVGSFVPDPDSVMVIGPKSIVDTITAIETMVIRLTDLSSSTTQSTSLFSPVDLGLLHVSPSRVQVYIGVEEFAETSFELPVEVRYGDSNGSKPPRIKPIPERVKVICLVPLRTFSAFNKSHLKPYVLFPGGKGAVGNLEVKIETSFQDVKIQGVAPPVVELVIFDNSLQ